ncbi:RPA-related protein RADX-like [Leucoraja erinacea]|uniref:RPA-related protein RADX-like n=1 Tax=Leucoraja erinaceus TaxID=7782 RepID=UPI002454C8DD|nr:RPA-related protein RADX-like [Leucoraja erinacea]
MAEGGQTASAFSPLLGAATTAVRSLLCRGPVAVFSVERCRRDPSSGGGLLRDCGLPPEADLYDVSLSDGRWLLRATLRPPLNPLVRRNELRCGCELEQLLLGVEYDERRASAGCRLFVVMEARVVANGDGAPSPLLKETRCRKLQDLNDEAGRWAGPDLPLRARRRSYLPLWGDSDYYGDVWFPESNNGRPPAPSQHPKGAGSICLRQLEGCISQKRIDHPPVLVRILRKYRLCHYGRPDRYAECPFQAKFLAADKSGMATLVLWNSFCMDWYRHLEPGMVIQLYNYVVKESYATRMGQDPGLTMEPALELNLNTRNPAADITIINDQPGNAEWQVPPLQYTFVTRTELSQLRPGDQCDVIGLVTFVGRQERIRSQEHAGEFVAYRWVHLTDGTAPEPFVLKLFSTCQPEIQAQIYPCSISENTVTFLVCTNVRVEGKMVDASGQTMCPHLFSTKYSQVFINGHHRGKLYVKNPKVKEFIQWIRMAKDKERERLSQTQIGGCYSFPPLPCNERNFRNEVLGVSTLTTMGELKQLLEQLEYREYRRVNVQGHICCVKYKSLGTDGEEEVLVFRPGVTGSTGKRAGVTQSPVVDRSYQGTGRNRSPEIPIIRTSPSQKTTPSPRQKRSRKGLTYRKRPIRMRLNESTESSEGETDVTQKRTCSENPTPKQDLSFAKACKEFYTSSDDTEMESSVCPSSGSWTGSLSKQQHVPHSGHVCEMVARSFHLRDKALLLNTFELQPSSFNGVRPDFGKKLHQCELACCRGYYTVTILGLNGELSLDTIFLPTNPRSDHRDLWPAKHDNSFINVLAHGGLSLGQDGGSNAEIEEFLPQPPGDVLSPVCGLEKMLFIFVLDVCSQGSSRVEVALNRAYVQHHAL